MLFRKLANRFATGPLLHFGQGKWYPGEPLPRWALNIFWRVDGEPLWQNPALYADEQKDYGVDAAQAAADEPARPVVARAIGVAVTLHVLVLLASFAARLADPTTFSTPFYWTYARLFSATVEELKQDREALRS